MGVVSRRWMWVESMGVASGCGCKEVIPTPIVSVLFCSSIPTFCSFFFNKVIHGEESLSKSRYCCN